VLRAKERQNDATSVPSKSLKVKLEDLCVSRSGEVDYKEGLADEQTYDDHHAKEDLHEETVNDAKYTQEGTGVSFLIYRLSLPI